MRLTQREAGIIKKITIWFIVALLLVALCGVIFLLGGGDGVSEGLEFELNSGGESYSVSGIGTCRDSHIVIPDTYEDLPVTAIGSSAFLGTSIKAVTVPEGVTTIGNWAFENCKQLTTVTLPEGLLTIAANAFYECDRLNSIELPSTLRRIGRNAFFCCRSLSSITIPDQVTVIEENAFSGCYNMTELVLGKSLETLGEGAFSSCWSFRSVTVPEQVAWITPYLFEDCRALTELKLPRHVSSIAEWSFQGCNNLTSLHYGGTVADWARMRLEPNWRGDSGIMKIVCSDGEVNLPTEDGSAPSETSPAE